MLASESMKIMSGFSTIRVLSAGLAASFMYMVFKYGGMAMATAAQNFTASAQKYGGESMRKTADPAEHGQWLSALNQSNAMKTAVAATGGMGNFMDSSAYHSVSQAVAGSTAAQHGSGPGRAGSTAGSRQGFTDAGENYTFANTRNAAGNAKTSGAAGMAK